MPYLDLAKVPNVFQPYPKSLFLSVVSAFSVCPAVSAGFAIPAIKDFTFRKFKSSVFKHLEIDPNLRDAFQSVAREVFNLICKRVSGRTADVYPLKYFTKIISGVEGADRIVKSVLESEPLKNIWKFEVLGARVIRFDLWQKIGEKATPAWNLLCSHDLIDDRDRRGSGHLNPNKFNVNRDNFILDTVASSLGKSEIDMIFEVLKHAWECREVFIFRPTPQQLEKFFMGIQIPPDQIKVLDDAGSLSNIEAGLSPTVAMFWKF